MLFDDTQSALNATVIPLRSPREIEFADALADYIASYADHPIRLQRPVRQLAASTIAALQGLGSAMSGGGKFPPVGIM
ncbi:MAG: hypothetical protein ABIQ30_05850 [Devosia sp.]